MQESDPMTGSSLFTVGHSTRTIDVFIDLLRDHGVRELVDVRSIPKSRRFPHFNSDALEIALRDAGIGYVHLARLGGRRHGRKDSVNLGWRNTSFRGYADYMATPEFAQGLNELIEIARGARAAIMCAEAVPWRCHRSLIADALIEKGWTVRDIISPKAAPEHRRTRFLKVMDGQLIYPDSGDA